MLRVEALPAREGDALWIEWGDPPRRMIVDMGTHAVGEAIHERIRALPDAERTFELLIITHVDRDHIGGVLSCLAEGDAIPGLAIRDVWFNGWDHLHGRVVPHHPLEPMGAAQGETLAAWLRSQRWNEAFGRGPVVRPPDDISDPIVLDGGLELTILGPTQARLADFIDQWEEEVAEAVERGTIPAPVRGLETLGQAGRPPRLENEADLETLALEPTGLDSSRANGSSIAVLARHGAAQVLLAGDAFAPELVKALELIKPVGPVAVDMVKLPHHGSEKNVTRDVAACRT